MDHHTLESGDAKSAFLQADQGIGTEALYTWGVPELQHAFGLGRHDHEALQVLGAIYGLTSAHGSFGRMRTQRSRSWVLQSIAWTSAFGWCAMAAEL